LHHRQSGVPPVVKATGQIAHIAVPHCQESLPCQGSATFAGSMRHNGGVFMGVVDIEPLLGRVPWGAGSNDVRLGGGVETIRQYLRARLVDEMHLAISPVVLGSGEHLLTGLDLLALGYQAAEHTTSEAAMHLVLKRSAS
jgi:dihydrofolate reductase